MFPAVAMAGLRPLHLPCDLMTAKRCFDLVVASTLLVLLAPVMLAVAVCVRVFLGSPVLFRQERVGHRGQLFEMVKFRSMRDACDADGQPLPDEQRMTRFGSLLRKSSLDELPELINVIRGEMSLVGPRPLPERYVPLYTPDQFRRHDVPPGITGWAQVNGRNAISWDEKFRLDRWYVDHQSLLLDLKTLVLTAWKIVRPSGITQDGHATCSAFDPAQSRRVVLLAAGDAAEAAPVVATLLATGHHVEGIFCDDPAADGRSIGGAAVAGTVADYAALALRRGQPRRGLIVGGSVTRRRELAARSGVLWMTVLDPSAAVDAGATIAAGCYVGAGARVGRGAVVGEHAVIGAHQIVADGVTVAAFSSPAVATTERRAA